MNRRHPRGAWAAVVCLAGGLVSAGCGSGSTVGPGSTLPPSNGNPPATALSLDRDLQPLFTARCAFVGCHAGSAPQEGLNLSAGNAFRSLVNVNSSEVPDRPRVRPGDPDASYLVEKISDPNPTVGVRMPLGASPLSAAEIEMIRNWIAQGALP